MALFGKGKKKDKEAGEKEEEKKEGEAEGKKEDAKGAEGEAKEGDASAEGEDHYPWRAGAGGARRWRGRSVFRRTVRRRRT